MPLQKPSDLPKIGGGSKSYSAMTKPGTSGSVNGKPDVWTILNNIDKKLDKLEEIEKKVEKLSKKAKKAE